MPTAFHRHRPPDLTNMPLLIIFLFALFLASSAALEEPHDATRQTQTAEKRHNRTIALAQLVNRYLDENRGTPPASLASLAATHGYEEANQYLGTSNGDGPFYVTYPLNNGTNSYNRVIVYSPPFDGSINATDYLLAANNACGTTDASQLGNWCGNPKGSFWNIDTLSRISMDVAQERTQQQQTLKKFASVYSTNQIYPNPGNSNGSAVTLISLLTGYALTPSTCVGVWKANNIAASCNDQAASGNMLCTDQWKTIPLTCEDLYTIWGTPRTYNYLDKDHIALYAEAPWNDSGSPIVVASQLDSR